MLLLIFIGYIKINKSIVNRKNSRRRVTSRRIQNRVEHIRCGFLRRYLPPFSCWIFSQKASLRCLTGFWIRLWQRNTGKYDFFSRLIHKENIIHLIKWERTAMIIGAEISSMIWKDNILRQMVCFDGFNLSRPDPGRREKINVNFCFHTSLWYLKGFYEGLKGLHKTF